MEHQRRIRSCRKAKFNLIIRDSSGDVGRVVTTLRQRTAITYELKDFAGSTTERNGNGNVQSATQLSEDGTHLTLWSLETVDSQNRILPDEDDQDRVAPVTLA